MSENTLPSNRDAVPVVETDIFSNHEDKQFAMGVFDSKDVLSYRPGSIEEAYLKLRADVYIDQTGYLKSGVKRQDGTELDNDDERSTHFVVLENLIGRAAVFACMRIIEKTTKNDQPLPIEKFFPEIFINPAELNTVEVSRFIVRHSEARYARTFYRDLIVAGMAHTIDNNLGPVFSVVEPEFEKYLKLMRLPSSRLTGLKYLPEYNTSNIGIEADKEGLSRRLGKEVVDRMTIHVGSFGYWGQMDPNKSNMALGENSGSVQIQGIQ